MTTATKAPTVQVTVATFDSTRPIFRIRASGNLKDFPEFRQYKPDNLTPLRDATMQMIEHLEGLQNNDTVQIGLLLDESGSMAGNRDAVIVGVNEFIEGMRDVPANEGGRVLCIIFTDGHENASTDVSPDALARRVSALENDKNWTFIYMGANQDAWDEGRANVGISGGARGQSVNFTSSPAGTTAAFTAEMGQRTSSYLAGQATYDTAAASIGNNSTIDESGKVVSSNPSSTWTPTPTPKPKPRPYGDVDSAIKKARGE